MINDCQPDPERLTPLQEAMDTYDIEGDDPDWYWNVLSRRTVVYGCGTMCRAGVDCERLVHDHDPAEYARCQALAAEAAGLMEGVDVGFGSEAMDYFSPFFIVASLGQPAPPATISPETVRTAFGGTIYPSAEIVVEPLTEQSEWWASIKEFADDGESISGEEADYANGYLQKWTALMDWFAAQTDLHHASFVAIGEDPLSDDNGGAVFPRMALALTSAGSWVGIYGQTVHT